MAAVGAMLLILYGSATGTLLLCLSALFLIPLELLRRGHYQAAANVAFAVLLVGAVLGVFQNRVGYDEDDFFRLTAIFSLGLTLTTFFGYHWWMGVAMGGAGLASMLAIFLLPYPESNLTRTVAELAKDTNPPAVVVIFIIIAGVGTLGLYQTGRILQRTRESQAITEAGLEDIQKVFGETQSGLEVSRQMEESAKQLQAGSASIHEELAILEAQTANLAQQAKEAGGSSGLLHEIQASLKEKMETQVRSIHQTSSALEEIDALFQTIATSSRTKKESLDELGQQAKEGERTLIQMSNAFAAMQKTAEDVLSVVQVIEDISSRTNLLAMNASIEAAHAGNSGRGFAVVAAEIRKLAEETGRNSQAIRQTLDANLTQVHAAVLASGRSRDLLQAMIRAFQDIQTLLGEQMNGMDEMAPGTKNILESVEELQSGTGAVQDAALSLEGAVLANRQQAENVHDAAQVLSEGVRTLQQVAETISSTAARLHQFGEQNGAQVQGLRTSLKAVSLDMESRKARLGS